MVERRGIFDGTIGENSISEDSVGGGEQCRWRRVVSVAASSVGGGE
jgi:hypothetical protein